MNATAKRHLEEARTLRDLGFYNDSSRQFDKALAEEPEYVPLILEAASLKMSQGLVGDCHAMLAGLESRLERASADPLHVAMFDVLFAFAIFTVTVKFKEPLRRASEAYTRHCLDRPVECFDKFTVAAASGYHRLVVSARQMAYRHDTPLPSFSFEFQSALVRYLLSEKRHTDAIKIAALSGFSDESFDNTAMLQAILADDGLSSLDRAEVLWEYGDKVRLADGGDRWRESLVAAAALYDNAGHASGGLDIRMDLMRHGEKESTAAAQDTEELWNIKKVFEDVGNWGAANRCLMAIADINTHGLRLPPESLQAAIEAEWLRITELCSNNSARASSSAVKILQWHSTKSKTARDLDYLEGFYQQIAHCDVPVVIAFVLSTLFDSYTRIGDTAKAKECISRRPEVLPRSLVAVLGIDPFEATLDAATEAADTNAELKLLRDELQKVRIIIRGTPVLDERSNEVQRLHNICQRYLSQHQFRSYDQLEQLVNCILPVIEEECKSLDDRQATIWRSGTLQSRALLVQIKSQSSKTMDELLSYATEVTMYSQQAADVFETSGQAEDPRAAAARAKLANSRRLLWTLKGRPAVSDDFSAAAALYAGAVGSGNMDGRQLTCLNLLRHWIEGYGAKVRVDPAVFQPSSAYEMAVKWANEADRLAGIQRSDLSALPRERAVLAKQMLSRRAPGQDFHMMAWELHDSADDDVGAWNWLQKSKARSVSDMLALGINIPKALKQAVESDAELISMCEAEQRLIRDLDASPAERLFLLQKQLESHRVEMRERPVLKQVLDYREGQPTSLEKLQSISARNSPESARSIFYIDWFVFSGQLVGYIASSTGVTPFTTGVLSTAITEWKAKYLSGETPNSHPLSTLDEEPLQRLSKLVQPLLDKTEAGDVLVFSPGGVLHGVPLHAATLAEDSTTSLLERNPVVYTASMTTFERCVAKEAERERSDGLMSRDYVAVYERTETGPLSDNQKTARDEIYNTVRKVAGRRRPCSTALGSEVNRERLISAFGADYMYFFGHCISTAENMLFQGLVLDDGPAEQHEAAPGGGQQQPESMPTAGRVFTASDVFAVDVQTSCLTLLACESAREDHGPGEEPLGMISALLCAGATAVVGTMWKVQVSTAKVFTTVLDVNLAAAEEGGGSVIDLAVAVQRTALRLKARGETLHPFHWAAFVLHGSWFMARRGTAPGTRA